MNILDEIAIPAITVRDLVTRAIKSNWDVARIINETHLKNNVTISFPYSVTLGSSTAKEVLKAIILENDWPGIEKMNLPKPY